MQASMVGTARSIGESSWSWLLLFFAIDYVATQLTGVTVYWWGMLILAALMLLIRGSKPNGMLIFIGLILIVEAVLGTTSGVIRLFHLMMGLAVIFGTIASHLRRE